MPMLLFDDDADATLGSAFCALALERGVYLHPKHNMFLSVAHRPQDVDQALQATDLAFEALAQARGCCFLAHGDAGMKGRARTAQRLS